MSKTRQVDW